jgi:phosphatidylinositol-3-phosphatase
MQLDPTRLELKLPRPWVCALLVAVFLGFGVLVGRASSTPRNRLIAATPRELRLLLPQGSDASGQTSPPSITPTPTPSVSSSEAAETPSTSTPESSNTGQSSHSKKTIGASHRQSGKEAGATSSNGSSKESGAKEEGASGSGKLPPIKHVFVIMLADEPYAPVFGPSSSAHYLGSLEHRGELLVRYYAVAHDELANEIALLSGQGPTPQTEVNCPTYSDIAPATTSAQEQVLGQGCVYPASTETIAGQLTAKHLTWKSYEESADSPSSSGQSAIGGGCTHPALGSADPTIDPTLPTATSAPTSRVQQAPSAYQAASGAAYATFRNPLLYFNSVLGSSSCAANNVSMSKLASDLSSAHGAPSLSYIVPSLCDDGNPMPCAPGRPAGLAPADTFLRTVVPQILASKSYKHGGLLVITVDQAPSSGINADSSSCCAQPRFPALPAPAVLPGGGSLPPAGGGQVGALLLSPYVKADTTSQETFNHFSLLATIENLFGLRHLGYAASSKLPTFGAPIFTAWH